MGRPIGSVNRQKPFADALRMEICAGNDHRNLRALTTAFVKDARSFIHRNIQPLLSSPSQVVETIYWRALGICLQRG
jgi:hypothetical protein